ncbi:hypothetical protein BGX26_001681 [Mortierella sp. AD094]|nr:hypothetical protein BGX26_001681 [Mortierella sp. AD094]
MDSNDCEHEAASVCSSQSYKTAQDYEDPLFEQQDGNGNDFNNNNVDQSSNVNDTDNQRTATARKNVNSSANQQQVQPRLQHQQQQQSASLVLPSSQVIPNPPTTCRPRQRSAVVAPTIYALASTVPHPTVNHLSINFPNQPEANEQNPTSAQPTTVESAGSLFGHGRERAASRSVTPVTAKEVDHKSRDDDIHPYFAGCNLPERSKSSQGKNGVAASPLFSSVSTLPSEETITSPPPPPPSAMMDGLSSEASGQDPQPSSSSFFTPSSNSKVLPEHQKIWGDHLNRDQVEKLNGRSADETTLAAGSNKSIGSRSTVFGFAPLYNQGSHQASMQSSEERVLRDGHVTLSIDRRTRAHASTASSSSSSPSSTSPSEACGERQSISSGTSNGSETERKSDYGSLLSVPDSGNRCSTNASEVNPLVGIPHARAGISPTLKLDQVEHKAEADSHHPVEESVESLFASKDWSATELGPRSEWPVELSLLITLMMKSASPLAIYWGDKSYLLYNDAWRPVLKQLHPWAMGTPGSIVVGESWAPLRDRIAQIKKEGRGSADKGLRLDLHREGYEEETYFDFTFSPIFLQDGSVGGILAIVQEVTQLVLNQRRLATLNQFSKQAPLIQSVAGAYSMITNILQESNNLDVPFSIVYKTKELTKEPGQPGSYEAFSPRPSIGNGAMLPFDNNDLFTTDPDAGIGRGLDNGAKNDKIRLLRSHFHARQLTGKKDSRRAPQAAILCSTSFDRNLEVIDFGGVSEAVFSKGTSTRHIPDSLLITPEEYEPLGPSDVVYDDPWAWPVRSVLADGVPRLVTLPRSTHKLARALLLPILENPSVLDSRITSVLIVGINPFQLLDNQYLDFLALLVANIASLLHFGQSREEERKSTEALLELNKAKISFFQNVSHELRTPLTLMLAPLEDVLSQTPENAPTRQNLEMVRRNSRRLLKLVNTLLQFSRIEAGKGHALFEETDLTKATREVSANFESVARGFGLEYIIKCESLENIPGGIWVDRAMWGGIILNLIGNAFKHTWEGSVTVHQYPSLGKNGREGVAVDVRDTGVGIAAEHLHTLFGRFNRIENKQSRSHEGTGIGLSLVKELTEVHGGEVSVTSQVDKGTCFHLWIPAGKSHHPSTQIKLGDPAESESGRATSRGDDAMNNKTDASMYVEEATQWIAHKSLPGSTLTASGTDSTEEEKIEEDDDMIHIEPDHLRDRQETIQMNTDFEISTMDLEEGELTKILLDPPASGDLVLPVNSLSKGNNNTNMARRSCLGSQIPRVPVAEISSVAHLEQFNPNVSPDTIFESSMNDDNSDYGGRVHTEEVMQEPEEAITLLPRAQSRRSYIVIVDDNNDMRSYLREILGKDFRVRCAVDGVNALQLINERHRQGKRIDLVLSDVAMPNMNGYELLKRLRNDPATMMTPIILLSARAGEEANVEGLDLGADDCLVKPFSARELLARVRSTIRLSDLRHELIREQRHALEMKQLIYSISVRIRSGLSLPQILDTASRELFKVIRCNGIRICRFRRVDQETGQHWVRFVSEIVRIGKPKVMSSKDRLLPKGLEVYEASAAASDHDCSSDLRHVTNYQHPIFGAKSFMGVALIYNRKIWGYLLASRDADMVDWSQSEKLLFEQTGNQISLAIAHASLWELKKSQQVEMEAAHAANETKSQILANTSHELRTPIGAIVGALSALEDTDYNLTSEQRDMVKIMQITSDVALSVINDLLDTAKLEAGAMSLNIKECPGLIETLTQSVRIFADKSGRKEVDLIMEPSEDLRHLDAILQQGSLVWTDGDRLQQVIMNLIGNAVKFTAAGKVVISCSIVKSTGNTPLLNGGNDSTFSDGGHSIHQETPLPQDGQSPRMAQTAHIPSDAPVSHSVLRFEVSDTGIGIDSDFLKNHIFKSFAQHDQSMTRRFGGTGLGLAISKHLVMMNGGILGVTSNVGQGSTFYFTWPFAVVGPSPSRLHQHQNAMQLQRAMSSRLKLSSDVAFETRVAVIESVPESRHLIGWMLEEQNVKVSLYESCDNVLQDERNRFPDLLGPDGSLLITNYRSNAHYFFCTRTNNAEAIVETARALGMLFRQRNNEAKSKEGNENYKDHIISVVLVVFSSQQGRYLAKDMTKRIRDGLEDTVECRYILKPVNADRIIECLQMLGSHAPFTRGPTGNIYTDGSSQVAHQHPYHQHQQQQLRKYNHIQQWRTMHTSSSGDEQPTRYHHGNNSAGSAHESNDTQSQIIPADNSVSLVTSDYERDNDCNKNTPESSFLDPDGSADNYVFKPHAQVMVSRDNSADDDGLSAKMTEKQSEPQPNAVVPSIQGQQQHHPANSSPAMQRRHRLKPITDGSGASVGRVKPVGKGEPSLEDSPKSSSDNPAFSNRAARAAAGKRERKGKCVLCVEDNIINLRVVQYQLQKLGYDTQSACDGQVAVDIIKAQVQILSKEMESSAMGGMIENGGTPMCDGAVGSADEFDSRQSYSASQSRHTAGSPSLHWNIRNGLLVIPESNKNMSHSFDQSEVNSLAPTGTIPVSVTATALPSDISAASVLSLGSPSLSSPAPSPTPSAASIDGTIAAAFAPSMAHVGNAPADLQSIAASSGSRVSSPGPPSSKQKRHPNKIDLILMDCAMPIKSGFDAASEIRTMGKTSSFAANIPIIALTASAVPSTKEKCIASGMNGYLSKPTKLADLEEILSQWITD